MLAVNRKILATGQEEYSIQLRKTLYVKRMILVNGQEEYSIQLNVQAVMLQADLLIGIMLRIKRMKKA